MNILPIRYIRNESVADDEMISFFYVTSLYTNVPIKVTLIIIKYLVNDPYLQTSEILRRIFQKHKFHCTFYSSDTLRKTLSNPKDKIEESETK